MAYGKIKADTLTFDNSGSDSDVAVSGILSSSSIGSTVQGFDADTAKTDTAQTFTAPQRGSVTTLDDSSGTITTDLSTTNNFTCTLSGTGRTLANPTNVTAGQSGVIIIRQDGTGSRTITTYGANWKFAGGTHPSLSTGANDVDVLSYYAASATEIMASLGADFS